MESNKISGILSVILGLIFIIFPIFSTAALSILIGISLVFFGIILILTGFTAVNIVIGILSIIVGLVFAFNISALSFLLGLQFYVIGLILILAGIVGLISDTKTSKIASVLVIILGIISFALGGFSIGQPMFAAVLIGVALIIEGISLYLE
ncbi:DUF308 domain-containing protein [Methanobrevibacter sp.]|uniref:DUF308 domain-containing protein n=1 Tax=Methanobrevibacter sp. TaxID=66852 RepID=UPI00386E9F18